MDIQASNTLQVYLTFTKAEASVRVRCLPY